VCAVAVGIIVGLMAAPTVAADRAQVTAALREIVQLAVARGVAAVARPDGFFGNPAIRIPVPDPLAKVESALRVAGEERRAEHFVRSLNRVAEQSSPAARPVLLGAVPALPFGDGQRILRSGESAATDALRAHALGRVTAALNPVVRDTMDRLRVARRYKRFVRDFAMGGLVPVPPVDLDAYVLGRTVDGIFVAIAQEERRIRTDPSARPTPLLREVFGAQR
jgi:hypothetical protein